MKKIFNSNALKLIAFFAMTLDHIGKILHIFYYGNEVISIISYLFSIIGRLTLPLILFLLIEGFYNTKNLKNYFLRLGMMAFLIGLSEIIISTCFNIKGASLLFYFGNIFIDLLLSLLFLFLINHKNLKIKFLASLPIIYFIISLILQSDLIYLNNLTKGILSGFLPQYSLISPIILIIYTIVYFLIKHFKFDKFSEVEKLSFDINAFLLEIKKYSFIVSIIFLSLVLYILTYVDVNLNTDFSIGTYYFLASIFIYFYNGKRGKDNKIIKSAFYLYYPLHICIIYLVTYLIYII